MLSPEKKANDKIKAVRPSIVPRTAHLQWEASELQTGAEEDPYSLNVDYLYTGRAFILVSHGVLIMLMLNQPVQSANRANQPNGGGGDRPGKS